MIALPPYILLIAFGVFLAFFLFFAIFNIVLLARFGARNAFGFGATLIFISGACLILFLAWHAMENTAWTAAAPLLPVPTFGF